MNGTNIVSLESSVRLSLGIILDTVLFHILEINTCGKNMKQTYPSNFAFKVILMKNNLLKKKANVDVAIFLTALHKTLSFPLRISLVNVNKCAVSCIFCLMYLVRVVLKVKTCSRS